MKFSKWQLSIAAICMVLGILLAVQFRTQERIGGEVGTQRVEDLTVALKETEQERQNLETEVVSLRKRIQDYEKVVNQGQGATAVMQDELNKSQLEAGLVGVRGTGIIVTMRDSDQVIQPGDDPNAFLIHDTDLLKVVNELKAAGAEAISVNEQRIVSMSEVRCAGPTILVNKVRLAPPYVIKAIGDPSTLENALRMPGGIIETLQYWGIQVDIKTASDVRIAPYKGSLEFQFAKPWKEGDK